MPDLLEVRYHDKEPEIVEVPERTYLYKFVPLNADLSRMTIPLWNEVKKSLMRGYLEGDLDHRTYTSIRRALWDPRLTMALQNDTRPAWGFSR